MSAARTRLRDREPPAGGTAGRPGNGRREPPAAEAAVAEAPGRNLAASIARTLTGLRLRLLVALLATSAVTLAVAAIALLGPLEQRLREDGVSSVSAAMTATRPQFANVETNAAGQPVRRELQRYANLLVQRTRGGQATVLNRKLEVLAEAPNLHTLDFPYPDYKPAKQTLRNNSQVVHSDGEALIVAQSFHVAGHHFALVVVKHLQYVATAFKVVQNAFVVAAAVGLGIALLLGIGLASRLLRRLERLRDATRRVEREGLEAELPEDSAHDEIGELTRSFGTMRSRLRRQEAARRAFVATASHELRTPLASLDGMLELLEDDLSDGALDLQDARLRTEHAREQTRRLSQLATDLLDISRLDSEVKLRREPLELGEISRAVVAEFERVAGKREVTLSVRPATAPCWAAADPGAVARIVRILIDNALRFAPPHTRVEVAPSQDFGFGEIAVIDEGPGVPAGDCELIFERFTRGSSTSGGFGLGLAIGRELAVRMGGSLELLDREPPAGRLDTSITAAEQPLAVEVLARRGGACFRLRLPSREQDGE